MEEKGEEEEWEEEEKKEEEKEEEEEVDLKSVCCLKRNDSIWSCSSRRHMLVLRKKSLRAGQEQGTAN